MHGGFLENVFPHRLRRLVSVEGAQLADAGTTAAQHRKDHARIAKRPKRLATQSGRGSHPGDYKLAVEPLRPQRRAFKAAGHSHRQGTASPRSLTTLGFRAWAENLSTHIQLTPDE